MGRSKDYMVPDVPEGKSGDWEVAHFEITEDEASLGRIRSMFSAGGRGAIRAGSFTKLTRNGGIIMSDTPDEIRDHLVAIRAVEDTALINGLGLGVVLNGMLMKPEVKHVTVIERSEDVIKLVGPHYENKYPGRVTIHQADAFEWKPPKGVRYSAVWHDIWDSICEDNLSEMHQLHRKYGRRADWQGSWCRDLLERTRRDSRATSWYY